jgi:lipoprotein-releasing system ATP-binding protein
MSLEREKPIILATDLVKKFTEGKLYIEVLHEINLAVHVGEMIAVVGPSGSGKSTLLHLLGGLDYPTSGKVEIDGINIHELSERTKGVLRNKYLGFIYQFHHLLPEFSALENVAMPLLIGGVTTNEAKRRAREILAKVGLEQREQHRVGELSGGERQRVAIARALVNDPKCVLADEPTGNLDHKTALQIYEMIIALNREFKTAFVIVTHDLTIAHKMQRVLVLEDGKFITQK